MYMYMYVDQMSAPLEKGSIVIVILEAHVELINTIIVGVAYIVHVIYM